MFTQEQIKLQNLVLEHKVPERSIVFALDLSTKKLVSTKQHEWVQKLIDQAIKSSAPKAATVSVTRIAEMLQKAAQHLEKPRIILNMKDGSSIRFKVAKQRGTGTKTIYVDGGSWGSPYYAQITMDGQLSIKEDGEAIREQLEAFLVEFNNNPAGVAAAYGHVEGNCCFCARNLTDERSTAVGYGPVCADHFGLPWG